MGKVKDILSKKGNAVYSIHPETTVYEALELMMEKNIGALLVTENEKLKGMFTERDYARKVILRGRSSKDTLVEEVMDYHPSVTPETSVEDCINLMHDKNMRHLPVLDGEQLLGLISIGDVVQFIINDQRAIIETLEHFITDTK